MRTATAITARDFSNTTRKGLYAWEPGMIRHIAKALDGGPALITVDSQTGHSVFGTIRGVQSAFSCNYNVVVEHEGTGQRTAYFMPNLGQIMGIDEDVTKRGAKWDAIQSYMEERGAAIRKAQAEHPELDYGKWEGTPGAYEGEVFVTYEPQREGAGKRWYGTVRV